MMKTFDFANFDDSEAVVNSSTIPASSCDMPSAFIAFKTQLLIGEIILDFPHPSSTIKKKKNIHHFIKPDGPINKRKIFRFEM